MTNALAYYNMAVSILFARKVKGKSPLRGNFTLTVVSYTCLKYYTKLEVTDNDIHASLLQYGRKSIICSQGKIPKSLLKFNRRLLCLP